MKTGIVGGLRKAILLNAVTLALWPLNTNAVNFNSSLLVGDSAHKDWNNHATVVAPGWYELDIYLDDEWKGKFPVRIGEGPQTRLILKKREALQLGITGLEWLARHDDDEDIEIPSLLHGGTWRLKIGEMRLDLTIPQAWVVRNDKNWVAPEKWDPGINGLYTSYNLNGWALRGKGQQRETSDSLFLALNSGLNLFGWHLIDNSAWQHDSDGGSRWNTSSRYVEKPVVALTSLLSVGDMYSRSSRFDNIAFRGVTLQKDKQMLPDKEQTYMPVIRGTASASAVVSVYQDGHEIYQIPVPPGPFAIRDLMPGGSRQELEVHVRYAGGRVETFTVPFAAISSMLRPGTDDFVVNAGQVRLKGVADNTAFFQGDYSRGINNYWTGFGGVLAASHYQSGVVGSAISLPGIGSITASVEQARYRLKRARKGGEKYALAWSKYLATRTNVTLASWYYRTRDYASFQDYILNDRDIPIRPGGTRSSKQAVSLSLTQPLGEDGGRLAADIWLRQYRDGQPSSRQYTLSYSNHYNAIHYVVSFGRSEYSHAGTAISGGAARRTSEETLNLSVTVPFSLFDNPASIGTRSRMVNGRYATSSVGVNGTYSDVDYSLELSHDREWRSRSADLYANWKTRYAQWSTSMSEASEARQLSMGASGSLLAWRGGVLASPDTGNSFVIVDAPGVVDARINGSNENRTNRHGQALVTGAVAYRMNHFQLEQDEAAIDSADILGNIAHVAPYEGSISRVAYRTDTRRLFAFTLQRQNGQPVSFGSVLYDRAGNEVGYVGQGGQGYIKADRLPDELYIDKPRQRHRCRVVKPQPSAINICRDAQGDN